MSKILNDFEVLTLFEAYKRILVNNQYRVSLPGKFSECKKNLPVLISEGLVHLETLKYTGMVVLTNKGIEKAEILYNAI